ncbi:MAG: endonuclease/exonuclease/phosphatase family protein [Bacteroidota bacterium]
MRRTGLPLLLFLFLTLTAGAQNNKNFTVLFYNAENLFDTLDASGFSDEEFTPAGRKNWTSDRYEKKINDIGRVMNSLPDPGLPDIIGLAEVENQKVLEDLTRSAGLSAGNYAIVHEESRDERGIDCALLYRKEVFRYKGHEAIAVSDPRDTSAVYRDILHVWGLAPDGKMIHFFVNHWKSRIGGAEQTEYQRMFSAVVLRRAVDQLYSQERDPRVVIMGDFNDEPTNKSLTDVLHAANKRKNTGIGDLYNLMYDMNNLDLEGSYNYRGTWQNYDQIIVSYNLLRQQGGLSAGYDNGKILKAEWMLMDSDGIRVPSPVYRGSSYLGGVSDHLPVYVVFNIK